MGGENKANLPRMYARVDRASPLAERCRARTHDLRRDAVRRGVHVQNKANFATANMW